MFFLTFLSLSVSHRILALLSSKGDEDKYATFFDDLKSLNCEITFSTCEKKQVYLERFGQKIYDTVVIMCGKSGCLGNNAEDLFEFVDNGGNAYVFSSEQGSELQDKIYRHLNLRVISSNKMTDIYGNKEIVLRKIVAPPQIISKPVNPLVYEGGYSTIDRPNDFRFPIVVGGLEHTPSTPDLVSYSPHVANDLIPISAFQARNGGRIVIIHSSTFALDITMQKDVTLSESMGKLSAPIPNGNRDLLKQLSEWLIHYKNHVKIVEASHCDAATGETPVQYHIKQNVTVNAHVVYTDRGEWKNYTESDVQVEVFMLGVFVRRHMKMIEPGHYQETLMLPDRAGNFKIKVFTDKEGWMNAREEMAIAIRPLAIREKEKFLYCAQPYQVSMMLIMAAAFLAAVHFLYHKPQQMN
ncbi:dolichyl-diphosphooligosaccharide--protein glycosyltransferase 48 kDa subunit [Histomonas meleagridis]|uniref:dolichyl-diphosphooligosaccharide--protein glycosyltransferase 48 kDa subunit n=1 Tax=Histomonas meleagridis TaxID=135588 RepID=UPI00355A746D|nr:dolichyl-diphosphooligosaccharide--protein glycosyltransferase 48 kDa subunit [Histomonas meleagridis]KAH0806961.1 dolichyl-diphosphooligosaccharide--protein glycosyltransferase 48 kDa subunit [Histomonas meleagridis]